MIAVSFVIDSLSRAGTESQLLALLRTLDRQTFSPSLVLLDGQSELSKSLEPHDLPVLRLGVTKLISRQAISAARQLKNFWKEHRPDIVQAYFLDSAYFSAPIAKLSGAKKIVRVRNNLGYWLTRKHRILGRLVKPLVDVTLTNCESARGELVKSGLDPHRVIVLENGVDLSAGRASDGASHRHAPSLARPANKIGCVANLREVKNIDGFMRAAAIVCREKPDATFAVAGEGPERAKLELLRASLGLEKSFHLAGSISDVPQFLTSINIAVLPSHSEGMSNALLEAMAAGKAIVATDAGANASVLGDAGLIVPPRNDEALAAAILRLLNDPELSEKLGDSARNRVEQHYSREAMRRRFEDFYREMNSGPGHPRAAKHIAEDRI